VTQNPYQQGPPQGPPPNYPPQAPSYPQPNQQGQYPPPQAPPYGTPPAQQGPPQGYPQAPVQQWPPASGVPQGVPEPGAPGDGWGDPGSGNRQDGDSPAVHQLDNRLVFIRPIKMHPDGKKFGTGEPEEQMFVDIVVCDGPPIAAHIHGTTKVETPFAAGPKVPPFFIGNAIINKAVMDKVMDYLPSRGTCLGRIVRRPAKGQGFPWADLAPATEQDKVLARQIFPHWDELKAAATPARPEQFATPGAAPVYVVQPPAGQGYPQQGPPPSYPTQNPYGAPPAQPQYPQQGPPQGYSQQPAYPPY